ncbi:MAG TPA: amidohydrolase family protein [Candidatus Binataceae bacterium]|nr:amidohydrolase family protein [Candidatus Binataceae bacterium]
MDYDVKIEGGLILDGSGRPGVQGSVAIKDGRMVAVGDARGAAARTIDAGGLVIAPGFVDIHTHYDAQVMWDRMLTVSPWHGVTTVVMGNCGFGVAPTRPEHRGQIMRTLEKVEGMSLTALEAGLGYDWPFETFPQYLDAIERRGVGINVGALVGHTTVRMYVMGEDAYERAATEDEIKAMQQLVREAMAAGAAGFATSKGFAHIGYMGRPVPSRLATIDEIAALTSILGESRRGTVEVATGHGLSYDEYERIARDNGRPISFSFLAGREDWAKMLAHLERMRNLEREGVSLVPQFSARPLVMEFNFREPFPLENIKIFKSVSEALDVPGKMRVYADPEFRRAYRDVVDGGKAVINRALNPDGIWISSSPVEPELEQRSVAEVSRERGVHPVDLMLDLSIASKLTALFRITILNDDEEKVGQLLNQPDAMLGLTDAGAHASQLCDACAYTYTLGHWVREKQALTLPQAVRMMTARPAEVYGLRDRGRIAVGAPADLVLFDPQTVGASPLRRVNDLPGGADRLISEPSGIEMVMVNGETIRAQGKDAVDPQGPMPGRVLRGGAAPSLSVINTK